MSLENLRKLDDLKGQVKRLETQIAHDQANCKHDWNEATYDPTYKKEGYNLRIDTARSHGSDPIYEYEGYQDVAIPRWKRTCKKCGKLQYANERETKVVDVGPKFKD